MKTCSRCKLEKPKSGFHKCASYRDGLHYICKECTSTDGVRNRENDPERYRARKRADWLRAFGLTERGYAQLLLAQDFRCAICGRGIAGVGDKRLKACLDHDHKTGARREILCRPCNTALGGFQDSPALLRRAAKYLEKHNNKN